MWAGTPVPVGPCVRLTLSRAAALQRIAGLFKFRASRKPVFWNDCPCQRWWERFLPAWWRNLGEAGLRHPPDPGPLENHLVSAVKTPPVTGETAQCPDRTASPLTLPPCPWGWGRRPHLGGRCPFLLPPAGLLGCLQVTGGSGVLFRCACALGLDPGLAELQA